MRLHYLAATMARRIEAESTLTDRYQTTVPETVRRALKIGKRDRIRYVIGPEGDVVLRRAAPAGDDDPVLAAFLGFIARDMAANPGNIRPVSAALPRRLKRLVGKVAIDLDAPLKPAKG